MANDWASENLQVIRTLMERSAIYRRALAPLMVAAGVAGVLATAIVRGLGVQETSGFVAVWMITAALVQAACLLLVRRQALRDHEAFWTLPARRVTAAVLPAYAAGGLAGLAYLLPGVTSLPGAFLLVVFWLVCHACALHASGAFTRRGIRLFAWVVFAAAAGAGAFYLADAPHADLPAANLVMGAVFGALHLLFGAFLYLTEPGKSGA